MTLLCYYYTHLLLNFYEIHNYIFLKQVVFSASNLTKTQPKVVGIINILLCCSSLLNVSFLLFQQITTKTIFIFIFNSFTLILIQLMIRIRITYYFIYNIIKKQQLQNSRLIKIKYAPLIMFYHNICINPCVPTCVFTKIYFPLKYPTQNSIELFITSLYNI